MACARQVGQNRHDPCELRRKPCATCVRAKCKVLVDAGSSKSATLPRDASGNILVTEQQRSPANVVFSLFSPCLGSTEKSAASLQRACLPHAKMACILFARARIFLATTRSVFGELNFKFQIISMCLRKALFFSWVVCSSRLYCVNFQLNFQSSISCVCYWGNFSLFAVEPMIRSFAALFYILSVSQRTDDLCAPHFFLFVLLMRVALRRTSTTTTCKDGVASWPLMRRSFSTLWKSLCRYWPARP